MKLNSRIALQQRSTTQDAAGQPILMWVDVATLWANIRYITGVEAIKSNASVSVAKASIRIRRRTDVTAGMRIVYGQTIFDIDAVLPDEENRIFMNIACQTGASKG